MKLIKFIIYILAGLILFSSSGLAHYHTLSGKVENESGKALVGATISIANTALGAKTNINGVFTIKKLVKGKFILNVSYIGYQSVKYEVEIEPNDMTDLDMGLIVMKETEILSSPVVVTATRTEKVYEDVPVKISVIDNRMFERTASVSIKDGLGFQPALRVENNCQNCGASQLRLNGLEGKYSQILIDGRAIFSALNSVYGLDQIPTNMIERVEVMRGGGSALYGGSAIAGVVNIITKQPIENTFSVDVNNSWTNMAIPDRNISMNTSIINNDQDLGMTLFGNIRDRAAWDANGDGFTELAKLKINSFGTNIFYKPSHLSSIKIAYNAIYHETRGGDSLMLSPHYTNICEMTKHNTNMFELQYEQFLSEKGNKLTAFTSFQKTYRDSYYGGDKDPDAYGSTDNNTLVSGIQYNHIIDDVLGTHIIASGYEYNRDYLFDKMPAYKRFIDQSSETHGLFIQDDWEISEKFDIVFGARIDKNNFIDKAVIIPRANILYKPFKNLSLRGVFSTGYRAPQTFDEDLHILSVAGVVKLISNSKELQPEYSRSFSFSADYSFMISKLPFAVSAEFFTTTIDDAFALTDIGKDDDGNFQSLRINANSASVTGGTFELQSKINEYFDFKAGFTYQKSIYSEAIEWSSGDPDNGIEAQSSDKILRTPDYYAFCTINSEITENLSLDISSIFTGEMYTPHIAGGIMPNGQVLERDQLVKTKAFFELNGKLSYKLSRNPALVLYVGVYNILNQFQDDFDSGKNRDSAYIYGPGRPRSIYGGVKLNI